jgi:hypothetical protein
MIERAARGEPVSTEGSPPLLGARPRISPATARAILALGGPDGSFGDQGIAAAGDVAHDRIRREEASSWRPGSAKREHRDGTNPDCRSSEIGPISFPAGGWPGHHDSHELRAAWPAPWP